MLTIYTEIVIACWAAFLFYWAISATKMKRTLSNPARGTGMLWRVICLVVLAVGAHFLLPILPAYVLVAPPLMNVWWGIIGATLSVVGVAIAIWARTVLGANWGMPMSVKEKPELVTGGPYALVRHPIYSGMILAILGSMMVVGIWWLVVFFIACAYFIFSARKEEALMSKEFPNDYPAYKARTWALVPFVY